MASFLTLHGALLLEQHEALTRVCWTDLDLKAACNVYCPEFAFHPRILLICSYLLSHPDEDIESKYVSLNTVLYPVAQWCPVFLLFFLGGRVPFELNQPNKGCRFFPLATGHLSIEAKSLPILENSGYRRFVHLHFVPAARRPPVKQVQGRRARRRASGWPSRGQFSYMTSVGV